MATSSRRPCPTCGREIEWSERFPYRPFCSDRCRLIDLGAWLREEHSIPGEASGSAHDALSNPADAGES